MAVTGAHTNEMILAAQRGSESALLQLLEVCRPQLQRYANHQCASDDVEEAVQDALWLLYRRVGALRVISAFSGWLFQIVRRECVRRARRRARWIEFDEQSFALATGGAADEDLRIDCSRAISALPQGYREVLVLRDITGLSSEEAAARLGIPLAAAKSRLHRARQMIRIHLQSVAPSSSGRRTPGKIEEKPCTSVTEA
jgi:RNA polymerase sigma factor (sigma-70 family)